MPTFDRTGNAFRAAPIIDYQLFVAAEKPEVPPSYELTDLDGAWLARDPRLPIVIFKDGGGRAFGRLVGHTFSEFHGEFLKAGVVKTPVEVATVEDFELKVLPRLAGLFVFLTGGALPNRLYMDHGGSLPMVYSPSDRRVASSVALLLDEPEYRSRFRADLHRDLIGREVSGWIAGTLTAHSGVSRVLPNHYLDLSHWTAHRFWPRPGDFATWRDFAGSVTSASKALEDFSCAASRSFKVAATLTAGFDSRLLAASCHACLHDVEFFTLEAPDGELDVEASRIIAERFGLEHRVIPLRDAGEDEMETWDRMVGDCMIEAPRRTHTTLRELVDRDTVFTGMYGEIGRCRLYRKDNATINRATINARFVVDRLTLPPNSVLLENIDLWLRDLRGQPNSVILDLAFHELKFGSWAMGQRAISNSIKLNLLPFAQRAVMEAFIGVEPTQKGTAALFAAIITRLWPEMMSVPVNSYGDIRDQLSFFKKFTKPHRIRRYLRDRLAKTVTGAGQAFRPRD